MRRQAIVLGLAGKNGSGKSTARDVIASHFAGKYVVILKTGDILAKYLEEEGREVTKENLQDKWSELAKTRGTDFLSEEISSRIKNVILSCDVIIWDAVRTKADLETLRGYNGFLIYVSTSKKTRYTRIKDRNEKVGEQGKTWKQFSIEEGKPTERFINQLSIEADLMLYNENCDTEEFAKRTRKKLARLQSMPELF